MICRQALPLPIALSLALTACQRPSDPSASNPEFIRLEGERLSRAQREELLRMRYERLAGPYEETVSLSHALESERAVAATLRERKQELEQAVTSLNDQKENLYRSALRAAQERAIGTQMDDQFEAKKRAAADQAQALRGANRLSLLRTTAMACGRNAPRSTPSSRVTGRFTAAAFGNKPRVKRSAF